MIIKMVMTENFLPLKTVSTRVATTGLSLMVVCLLGACSKTSVNALPSDNMPKSICDRSQKSNCKLRPFYVDGHWIKPRKGNR